MGAKGNKVVKSYPIGFHDLPLTQLVKADWNYKEEDVQLSAKLRENIKRNGQIENIIVRELKTGFFEVVNGNHRYDVLSELGFPTVMCYNFGPISDNAARRIAIETNETKFATDHVKLSQLIKDVTEEFDLEDLTQTMPYSEVDLEKMSKLTDFSFDSFAGDGSGSKDKAPVDTMTIKIVVTPEVQERWKTLIAVYEDKDAEANEGQIFEFAVSRALHELEPKSKV